MDSDVKNPDSALHVRFQMITVYQTYDSENALLPDGETPNPRYTGNPVYKDIPHIEITTPGGQNRIVQPVRADHKARFKRQWDMFVMSQGDSEQIVGTPLSQWPAISRSRAEELRAMKFFVIEQIAEASDQQVQGIGMDGITLRQRAQQFLKTAKDTAIVDKQSAELAAKQKQLDEQASQIKALQEQMLAFMTNKPAVEAQPKRKGRPPKVKPESQPAEAT